jgi:hypothetical protein
MADETPQSPGRRRRKKAQPSALEAAGEARRRGRGSGYDDYAEDKTTRPPALGDPDTDERRCGLKPRTS